MSESKLSSENYRKLDAQSIQEPGFHVVVGSHGIGLNDFQCLSPTVNSSTGLAVDADRNTSAAHDLIENDENENEEASENIDLAILLMAECRAGLSLANLDNAVFLFRQAVEDRPTTHPFHIYAIRDLASALGVRFMYANQSEDLMESLDLRSKTLQKAATPTNSTIRPGDEANTENLVKLAKRILNDFQKSTPLHVLNDIIFLVQISIARLPSVHRSRHEALTTLADALYYRFYHSHDMSDLDSATSTLQLARDWKQFGINYRIFIIAATRSDITGDLQHLATALQWTFQVYIDGIEADSGLGNDLTGADLLHFVKTDLKPWVSQHAQEQYLTEGDQLANQGISSFERFESFGSIEDIDKAISKFEDAVRLTPNEQEDKRTRLGNLGTLLFSRFQRLGELKDIEKAILNLENAVRLTPSNHSHLPTMFTNLGISYTCRFEHTRDLPDIDCAISYHQMAVESIPFGDDLLPKCLNNLGNAYLCRFSHTNDIQDIDHAILNHQNAVKYSPSGHIYESRALTNLGSSYLHRFMHTGELQDIDHAISHHHLAIASTPSGHADLSGFHNNLGNSYSSRAECTNNLQDLDLAISHHKRAVQSIPSDHAGRPTCLNSLGNSYLGRFKHTGDLQDIDQAILYHESAVQSTPDGHANLPNWLNSLSMAYAARYKETKDTIDAVGGIFASRGAAEANGPPSIRLKAAKRAAITSAIIHDPQCLHYFALSIGLLSEVAGLEQTIHRRLVNLHDHADILGPAVATALSCDRVDFALEWLEQGRCLVWNQLNQLRTPIDDLRERHPDLADRFIKTAGALESYGARSPASISSSEIPLSLVDDIRLQNETRDHTILASDYKKLLKEIRALPNFYEFLLPPKATDLTSSLPTDGPVIIFNFHKSSCDALALIAGSDEPLHIPLKGFSLVQAEKLHNGLQSDLVKLREVKDEDRAFRRFISNSSSMSFILRELWCKVVQPVLEALGYGTKSPPSLSERGRIWWCPTGPLAFLPLHAAGIYSSSSQTTQCVSDFVVSSYTPSVGTLKEKFKASSMSRKPTSLIIISQPNTPGLPPIPSTKKEAHDLKKVFNGTAISALLLEDAEATIGKVRTEMRAHSWAHFACHGVQDISQPLISGLCLHDGRLELLEIAKQEIPDLDLAFLSACQTSKGDRNLSEEVVHFAAGMLAAGYRGVVGTMWNISDRHGPKFASEFYKYLLEKKGSKGLDSAQAAYALDYATRKVLEELGDDDAALLTWVPYVHFGY